MLTGADESSILWSGRCYADIVTVIAMTLVTPMGFRCQLDL